MEGNMSINLITPTGQKLTRHDWTAKRRTTGQDTARRTTVKAGTNSYPEEFPWTEWVE
jgi:hypothetical protein